MLALDVFRELESLGVRLEAVGGELRFAPRALVTSELVGRMRECKGELLAMLSPAKPAESLCREAETDWPSWFRLIDGPPVEKPRLSQVAALPPFRVVTVKEGCRTNQETTWRDGQGWITIPPGSPIEPIPDLAAAWDRHAEAYGNFVESLRVINRGCVRLRVGRLGGLIRAIRVGAIAEVTP